MVNENIIRCKKCYRYCFYVFDLKKYKCACGATWDLNSISKDDQNVREKE